MRAHWRRLPDRFTARGDLRVPAITATFWLVKGLSTAMGESTSDFLVHAIAPPVAVVLGFVGFVIALSMQFKTARYVAWTYWSSVVMVGIFGTMAADVVHVGFGVPYSASSVLYAVVLAVVFVTWRATEKTLSIHSVDSPRREAFYWATVMATFAMGTALGDFSAYTLHLGYFPSALMFAAVIAVPAVGYRSLNWNSTFAFWFAYVITRPLGASLADGAGKAPELSGLGLGAGWVVLVLGLLIGGLIAYLGITKSDLQPMPGGEARFNRRSRGPSPVHELLMVPEPDAHSRDPSSTGPMKLQRHPSDSPPAVGGPAAVQVVVMGDALRLGDLVADAGLRYERCDDISPAALVIASPEWAEAACALRHANCVAGLLVVGVATDPTVIAAYLRSGADDVMAGSEPSEVSARLRALTRRVGPEAW